MEFIVTSLKDVHLWEEELRVSVKIKLSIELSESCPEAWTSSLAKFTMEHYNRPLCHQLSYSASILDELFLQITNIVDVEGTLYVTTLILIIPSTINYDVGML